MENLGMEAGDSILINVKGLVLISMKYNELNTLSHTYEMQLKIINHITAVLLCQVYSPLYDLPFRYMTGN